MAKKKHTKETEQIGAALKSNEAKQHEESLKIHEEAIKKDPTNAGIWDHKGLLLDEWGRHEEALKAYKEIIQLVFIISQ